MTDVTLPWRVDDLAGFNTSSGYTYDGGTFTGGGPCLDLTLTVRWWSRYGEPATVQIDVGDRRNGTSVSLKPEVARQAAAALLAAADRADEDMAKWLEVLDKQKRDIKQAFMSYARGKAGDVP